MQKKIIKFSNQCRLLSKSQRTIAFNTLAVPCLEFVKTSKVKPLKQAVEVYKESSHHDSGFLAEQTSYYGADQLKGQKDCKVFLVCCSHATSHIMCVSTTCSLHIFTTYMQADMPPNLQTHDIFKLLPPYLMHLLLKEPPHFHTVINH